MRRFVLGLAVVLVLACVARPRSPFYADNVDGCTTLRVDNQNFSDVRIYWADRHERIGLAPGLTVTTFELCEAPMRRAVFTIDAIGGAFEIERQTASGTLTHNPTVIIVGPHPRMSRVIGG